MATVKVPDTGKMRFVVRFENPEKLPDGAGGTTEDYTTSITTRGYMEERSGFNNFNEGTEQLVTEWDLYCHWRRVFDSYIFKDTRVVYENKFYKIIQRSRVDQNNQFMYMKLIAAE